MALPKISLKNDNNNNNCNNKNSNYLNFFSAAAAIDGLSITSEENIIIEKLKEYNWPASNHNPRTLIIGTLDTNDHLLYFLL